MTASGSAISTKPYLVRAIYEWCTDSGMQPYIAVTVDERTRVPLEFVRDGGIVLNISAEATDRLHIGNDLLEFDARFGGVARHVSIPIDNIGAIYARETGQGMAFEVQPVRAGGREPAGVDGDGRAHEQDAPASVVKPVDGKEPAGESSDDAPVEHGARPARRTGRRKPPALAGAQRPDQAADMEQTPAVEVTSGRKAPAKRARKTVLRDVSASVDKRAAPAAEQDPRDSGAPDPDGPKPGKPHLTRVK